MAMRDKYLQTAKNAGVFHLASSRRKSVEQASAHLHFARLSTDIGGARTSTDALRKMGRDLHFPQWYGANFDALFDCLSDPEWQPAPGHILFIEAASSLYQAEPDSFTTLIEVLRATAQARSEAGRPFWIFLDTSGTGIPDFPSA